jgi:hypothetical protein
MRHIKDKAIGYATGHQAVQAAEAGGGEAVLVNGRHLVVSAADVLRLAAAGVAFAHLCHADTEDGPRVVAVPVNSEVRSR